MVDVLVNNHKLIADACPRFGVSRLDVFGSALSNEFRPGESDLDLLVELGPMDLYDRIDAYFERTNRSCMPREARAYLANEACDAITLASDGLDLQALKKSLLHQAFAGQL